MRAWELSPLGALDSLQVPLQVSQRAALQVSLRVSPQAWEPLPLEPLSWESLPLELLAPWALEQVAVWGS